MTWTELTQHVYFPFGLLLAGVLLAALALGLLIWKIIFFRRSRVTLAQGVAFEKRSALEGNVWHSTVTFSDHQAQQHQLEYIGSGPYPPFAKMAKLRVYYDPENPKKARAYSFWKVWTTELALVSMALLLIVLGAGNL